MDKEKFIKKAKECGYTDEMINEILTNYENDVRAAEQGKGPIPVDPTKLLIKLPRIYYRDKNGYMRHN